MQDSEPVVVVGAGFVGLPLAAALAAGRIGGGRRRVVLLERSGERLDSIRMAMVEKREPLGEPGLRQLMSEAYNDLDLESDAASVIPSTLGAMSRGFVAFVCVGTPPDLEHSPTRLDHSVLLEAIREVVRLGARMVIVRSTISPIALPFLRAAALGDGAGAFLILAPEFLREGHAVEDVLRPSRIIVGADDLALGELVVRALQPTGDRDSPLWPERSSYNVPGLVTDLASASIAKLAANALLAERAAWATRTAWVAEAYGGDAAEVYRAVGLDPRLSTVGVGPGLGVGGPCLPKDSREFGQLADDASDWLPSGASGIRRLAIRFIVDEIRRIGSLEPTPVVVIGLGFKPDSSDPRESPAAELARDLAKTIETWAISDEPERVALVDRLHVVSELDEYPPSWMAAVLCRRPRGTDFEILLAARTVFDPYALLSIEQAGILLAGGATYRGTGRGEAWMKRAQAWVAENRARVGKGS